MDREVTPTQGTEGYYFLAPPRAADEIGRLSHFRVLRLLGHGGMGIVFQAEDTKLERPVALKVMRPEVVARPEAAARFLREARAMAAIKHEHVVTIYEAGEDRGVPFLAMELLSGLSLHDWLKQGKSTDIGHVVEIGLGIASGLNAAHARGLVHRDIKPSNVWLESPENKVKILDFGLARGSQSDSGLTQFGAVVGTPQYMSPEQANCQSVDRRSDLFSLGCILFRLSTGRLPFHGQTPVALLAAIAMETPPSVCDLNPAVPTSFGRLVTQLLAKDPELRPNSAAEVLKGLEIAKQDLLGVAQSFTMCQPLLSGVATPMSGSTVSIDKDSKPRSKGGSRTNWFGRRALIIASLLFVALLLAVGYAIWPAPAGQHWVYADLDKEPESWKVYAEGQPKWECTQVADSFGGGHVLRCSLSGGAPYSNAHFYRNLLGTGSDGTKKFTLSLSFRFSPTTSNNQGGKSTVQALEFTASEWRGGRRHEFALQWLNIGPNAPCWRYWNPHNVADRWRDLGIPALLEADRWHTLRLEGIARNDQTVYQRFAIDGRTHELGIEVTSVVEPDQPDRVAVGVQLDGNSHQDSYEVHLDKVSVIIDKNGSK